MQDRLHNSQFIIWVIIFSSVLTLLDPDLQEHPHPVREERPPRDEPCPRVVLRRGGALHLSRAEVVLMMMMVMMEPSSTCPGSSSSLASSSWSRTGSSAEGSQSDFLPTFFLFQVFFSANQFSLPDECEPPSLGDQRLGQLPHLLQLRHQVERGALPLFQND